MYTVDLKELYNKDYHINRPVAINQVWKNTSTFRLTHPRKTSGLTYLKNCSATYFFNDKQLSAPLGSAVYIPQGFSYTVTFCNVDENADCTSQLINLEFLDSNNDVFVLNNEISILSKQANICDEYFDNVTRVYSKPNTSYSQLRSAIYALMYKISSEYNNKSIYTKKFLKIADGVTFIEQNLHKDFSIEMLSRMCYLSPARFRTLFHECIGMSPREYKAVMKIHHAKRLLGDEILSIKEIAETLGFRDVAYFSRFFKDKTSLSPTEYIKQNRQ